jgi:hypothetical protein
MAERDNHSAAVSAALEADGRIRVRLGVTAAALGLLLLGIVVLFANWTSPPEPSRPVLIVHGPDYDKPAIQRSAKGSEATPAYTAPRDSSSEQHESASSVEVLHDSSEDHELHLIPNLFGHGVISDTRTYSVALIADYRGYLPRGTELFMQGRLLTFGPGFADLVDEQHNNKHLLCYMTEDEFDEVIHLYHIGEAVQVVGEYAGRYNAPVFNHCRVASPTDNVVRPAQPANAETTMKILEESGIVHETGDSEARPNSSRTASSDGIASRFAVRHETPLIGPHRFVLGVLKNVHCDNPALDLNVISGETSLRLHTTNYFKVQYSVLNVALKGDLNPCADLEGQPAKVEYVESAVRGAAGVVVGIEIHK